MRFVPIKSVEQQAVLSMRRVREGFVKARTAQANQIRGLLSAVRTDCSAGHLEYRATCSGSAGGRIDDLPGSFRQLVQRLMDHLKELDNQVVKLEREILQWHRDCDASRKLAQIPGIGPITECPRCLYRRREKLQQWPASCIVAGTSRSSIRAVENPFCPA